MFGGRSSPGLKDVEGIVAPSGEREKGEV